MFLQFLTPKGHPVYLRPELVASMAGYHTTIDGRPALATRITLTTRDDVFVRGDVDAIKDAVQAWHLDSGDEADDAVQTPSLYSRGDTITVDDSTGTGATLTVTEVRSI